jgi:hypothetical protein
VEQILDFSEDLTDKTLNALYNLLAETVDITLQVVGLLSAV